MAEDVRDAIEAMDRAFTQLSSPAEVDAREVRDEVTWQSVRTFRTVRKSEQKTASATTRVGLAMGRRTRSVCCPKVGRTAMMMLPRWTEQMRVGVVEKV
jgi:hypothetical protein